MDEAKYSKREREALYYSLNEHWKQRAGYKYAKSLAWGESINRGAARSASSSVSGKIGLSLRTVVNILTVETVTSSRNAVSTSEHLVIG